MAIVRVLPRTPLDDLINFVMMRRSELEELITFQIGKDGSVLICGSGVDHDPHRLVGILEHIKKDLLDGLTCESCGTTTIPTGPEAS